MKKGYLLMYHPESDSLFEVHPDELPDMFKTPDGQLCEDVTGNPEMTKRFIREERQRRRKQYQ